MLRRRAVERYPCGPHFYLSQCGGHPVHAEGTSSFLAVDLEPKHPIHAQVSKLYYYLTHQPIIWKRFLRHLSVPIPPLPPTSRYGLGELDFEAERLVFRAISLDDNWRSFSPKTYRCQRLKIYNQVLAMTVLPGGKYLVASVRDTGCNRYAIMVFVLDHATRGSIALAKTPTKSKAYNLQAKYLAYNGVQGIAIAYIRRKFKSNKRCGYAGRYMLENHFVAHPPR